MLLCRGLTAISSARLRMLVSLDPACLPVAFSSLMSQHQQREEQNAETSQTSGVSMLH